MILLFEKKNKLLIYICLIFNFYRFVLTHETLFTTLNLTVHKFAISKNANSSISNGDYFNNSYKPVKYGIWSPNMHNLTAIEAREQANYKKLKTELHFEDKSLFDENLNTLIHSLFAQGSSSKVKANNSCAYIQMTNQYAYNYNKHEDPASFPTIILLHSGVKVVFELFSYVIRFYELPIEYYKVCHNADQLERNLNIIRSNPLKLNLSNSNGYLPINLISLLYWDNTIKQLVRNLLSSITWKPLSEIFMVSNFLFYVCIYF